MDSQIKPIALFDMDGTVCDHDKALLRDLELIRSPSETPITDVRTAERHPYIHERMRLIKSQPGWWENLEKIPLGMDLYNGLIALNFRVSILTKGPRKTTQAWTEKVNWCHKHLGAEDISVTMDKGLIYGKILVDDFEDYAMLWLKWRPRGLVIMPENEQNKNVKHPNIFVCNESNIEEALAKCKSVADKFFSENNQLN